MFGGLFGGDSGAGGGGGGAGFFSSLLGQRFSCELQCFPVSFVGREDLELGNRLILPPAALQKLQGPGSGSASPLLFEISDLDGRRHTHGGVLEFTAAEERCYMPFWMLRQLGAQEGDILRIGLKQLPKATFARIRPDSVSLLRVYNPRALLESGLKGYVALTDGDSIAVEYDGRRYGLEVVEVRPGGAGCIIDADVEIEFATPKEAEAAAARAGSRPSSEAGSPRAGCASPSRSRNSEEAEPRRVFVGAGRRLDGGAVEPSPEMLEEEEQERDLRWRSASRSGGAVLRACGNFEDMPWKQRIPQGVKWTRPPYGVDLGRLQGEDYRTDMAASSSEAPPRPATNEAARARALEAAEVRYAQNAEDIERRRRELEEERQRQRQREAEQRAQEEARKKRAAEVAIAARAAQGAKERKPARQGFVARLCGWLRGSGGKKAGAVAAPARV